MKSSTKWVLATVTVLVIAAYWYYQEQSCSLLTVHIFCPGETSLHPREHMREQASGVADKLAASSIREIYTSSEKCTHETATIIASKLHMQVIADERLHRVFATDMQHLARQRLKPLFDFFHEMAKKHKSEIYMVGHTESIQDLLTSIDYPTLDQPLHKGTLHTFVYNPCSGSIRYEGHQELGS